MAAMHAVLNTYELIDNILVHLPKLYIYRAAQVSKLWRTVTAESPAVAELLEPLRPLISTDLKVIAAGEVFDHPCLMTILHASMKPSDQVNKKELQTEITAFAATSKRVLRSFPANVAREPSYARAGKGGRVIIDMRLKPKIVCFRDRRLAGVETPLGTTMKMELPTTAKTESMLGPPGHFVTLPPVTAITVEIGSGVSAVARVVYAPKGVRFGDLVQAQKALLKAHYEFGSVIGGKGEPECCAFLTVKVWIDRLRKTQEMTEAEKTDMMAKSVAFQAHVTAAQAARNAGQPSFLDEFLDQLDEEDDDEDEDEDEEMAFE